MTLIYSLTDVRTRLCTYKEALKTSLSRIVDHLFCVATRFYNIFITRCIFTSLKFIGNQSDGKKSLNFREHKLISGAVCVVTELAILRRRYLVLFHVTFSHITSRSAYYSSLFITVVPNNNMLYISEMIASSYLISLQVHSY